MKHRQEDHRAEINERPFREMRSDVMFSVRQIVVTVVAKNPPHRRPALNAQKAAPLKSTYGPTRADDCCRLIYGQIKDRYTKQA